MKVSAVLLASVTCLVFAVLLYVTSVAGVFFDEASPANDMGLVSTTVVFLLFGVFGLMLERVRRVEAASE